jgi:hypothetical protein
MEHRPLRLAAFLGAAILVGCGRTATPPTASQPPASSSSVGFIAVLQSAGAGCVDPEASPLSDYVTDQDLYTVHRGAIVAIYLVEPEMYLTSSRATFPWVTPTSSDGAVLEPVISCSQGPQVPSLPVSITLFRAVGVGRTSVRAGLSTEWSSPSLDCVLGGCPTPLPYGITVDVTE